MVRMAARISLGLLLVLALVGAFFMYGFATVVDEVSERVYVDQVEMPVLSARAWLVYDVSSGRVLFSHEPDLQLPIASVTKLVSATQFYEQTDLSATTSITWLDVAAEGRAGKLTSGDVYSHHELLFPLLLESSNDAAAVLERIDPSLIERMNTLVQKLELLHTAFVDASGLSSGNVSTARELYLLSQYLYEYYPHIFDITRLREYYAEDNGWFNNNPLSETYEGYHGGKHGFTYEANRTAVAFAYEHIFSEDAQSVTPRLLGFVLLGSDNLEVDMQVLHDYIQDHVTLQ